MRDDQTAFDYLTGALTGGARPDAVGRKFTPDGTPLSCPGFTTVCHVEPASDAFLALVQAQGSAAHALPVRLLTAQSPQQTQDRTAGAWGVSRSARAEALRKLSRDSK